MGNSPFAFSLFLAVCCKHISEAVVVGGPPLSSGFCISRRLWRAVFYLLWSPPPRKVLCVMGPEEPRNGLRPLSSILWVIQLQARALSCWFGRTVSAWQELDKPGWYQLCNHTPRRKNSPAD